VDGDCVEVAVDGDRVLLRDTKKTSAPELNISRTQLAVFIAFLKTLR
jgi:hypothetical protein